MDSNPGSLHSTADLLWSSHSYHSDQNNIGTASGICNIAKARQTCTKTTLVHIKLIFPTATSINEMCAL